MDSTDPIAVETASAEEPWVDEPSPATDHDALAPDDGADPVEAPWPDEAAADDADANGVEAVAFARDTLDQILQAMGVEAAVSGEEQGDGAIRLLIEGSDMGVVIGKHGGTINALQYLLGLMVHKRVGERLRLVIDAEGYRSRREQALRELATTYARRVRESGQEAVLDALQAYERRVIHQALADDPDVFTYSEGEEPDRRVVISPREVEAVAEA